MSVLAEIAPAYASKQRKISRPRKGSLRSHCAKVGGMTGRRELLAERRSRYSRGAPSNRVERPASALDRGGHKQAGPALALGRIGGSAPLSKGLPGPACIFRPLCGGGCPPPPPPSIPALLPPIKRDLAITIRVGSRLSEHPTSRVTTHVYDKWAAQPHGNRRRREIIEKRENKSSASNASTFFLRKRREKQWLLNIPLSHKITSVCSRRQVPMEGGNDGA